MKRLLLPALIMLNACGTPQEQCVNTATRDLRIVDRLIAEAEGNLARGYAYETVTVYETEWVNCTPYPTETVPNPAPRSCFEQVPETSRKPVAINLAAEQSKLESLQAKRASQARAAAPTIAECKALNPE